MNDTPQLQGYELDQRLLEHPLAEIWRGRSFTGMEVVALVLSERGAADAEVRERLGRASRTAALEPGELQTPLWAANLAAARPYAVTQLVAGQSGAERLLDPLDGLLGNDEESLGAVRSQLAAFGAAPIPGDTPDGAGAEGSLGSMRTAGVDDRSAGRAAAALQTAGDTGAAGRAATDAAAAGGAGKDEQVARDADRARREAAVAEVLGHSRLGRWGKLVAVLVVLAVFCVSYSVGAKLASATKEQSPARPAPALVEPAALPSPAIRPGIAKPMTAPFLPPTPAAGLIGATYDSDDDVQQVTGLGLPFVFGWPRPPTTVDLGVSDTTIYRQVLAEKISFSVTLDAKLALRPCPSLTACLADRAAFDREWTGIFKVAALATPKAPNTWLMVTPGTPYTLTMTRAFTSSGKSWLLGVTITAVPGEEPAAQRVLNDIWRQIQ